MESLKQMSSRSKCAAPKAAMPGGKGVLQESNSSSACDSWIPETAAAPAADSDKDGLQKPGRSK